MAFNPTPSQKKALEALGKNTIVSAGAGSGKTAVLSEKVKYLVEEKGMSTENMLILTFTNLAAKEMKDRIQTKLKENSKEEAIKVLSADICTFDSFALSLVKKYHLLLNLDENINIVSDKLILEKRKKWIDELFDELYVNEDPLFMKAIDRLVLSDDEDVKELISEIISKSSLCLSIDDYFSSTPEEEKERLFNEAIAFIEKELLDKQEKARNSLYSINNEKYKISAYEANAAILEAKNINDFCCASIGSANSYSRIKIEDEEDQEAVKIFKENRTKILDYKKILKTKEEYKEEYFSSFEIKDYFKKLAKIIYDKEMEFKYSHQVFEFQDIAFLAYKLVKENESIREELKNKYKIIMVDEYQDTSFSQERFLKLIENNNMFMVGDIKQSIYRFRNARPDIFQNKYNNYALNNGGIKIDLNENFRSRKEVLDDINTIFKDTMSEEYGSANYKKDHVILPGNKMYDTLDIDTPKTESLIYEKDHTITSGEQEANLIADDILSRINNTYIMGFKDGKPIKKKANFSSFCILIDRRKDFPTYMRVFEERGIPLFVQDNEKISSNYLVRITQNVLLFIDKINNKEFDDEFNHLFVSLARSFIFNYSDEKIYKIIKSNSILSDELYEKFISILSKVNSTSLEDIITTFYNEIDIYSKLFLIGSYNKNKAYLDSFLSYFKEMDLLNYSLKDAAEFIRNITKYNIELELPSQSTSEDAVKLMNIHKSKGLEFPIVYYPGLHKKFNDQEFKKKDMVSNKFGIIFSFENGDKTIDYMVNKLLEQKDSLSEEIRLFYVSLTRAREKMIFVYPDEFKIKPLEESKCFLNLLKNSSLNTNENKVSIINNKNSSISNNLIDELEYKDMFFEEVKQEKVKKCSKIISLDSSNSALNLGTDIHFLFKVADFASQDLSLFNSSDARILKRFYSSSLFSLIKDGKIYKEYEFVDSTTKGIIDMFSILDDKIILVDYKLKDLSDEAYIEQLNTYAQYLEKTFSKEVEAYLYAIFTSETKKVI